MFTTQTGSCITTVSIPISEPHIDSPNNCSIIRLPASLKHCGLKLNDFIFTSITDLLPRIKNIPLKNKKILSIHSC